MFNFFKKKSGKRAEKTTKPQRVYIPRENIDEFAQLMDHLNAAPAGQNHVARVQLWRYVQEVTGVDLFDPNRQWILKGSTLTPYVEEIQV